ncbi:MAG: helix-turn-helix transcriptional regulator [Bacteroidetes bacterium]|nr:helix-turn-helix transcriptional regulator [Bacteroidota bacterium]MCB0847780.1 helix-turn-helix transcriptional regulator [Bacteroidota bacterium]
MTNQRLRDDTEKVTRIAKMMKHLGNPVRLAIVEMLIEKGPMTVKSVYEAMQISQSNASQHLRSLEQAEILYSHREGTNMYYAIDKPGLPRLMQCALKTVLNSD